MSEADPMLSKCANPACSAHFRYLHEGQIFNLDRSPSSAAVVLTPGVRLNEHVEHFWLCGHCSARLKLTLRDGRVVTEAKEPNSRRLQQRTAHAA
jgi:hypothetical protein